MPSASREIVLPAIAKPDQLYNRNRLPLASEFSHCCACHVICMCIKRCLFVFVASKKGPCGSCKQRQMGEISCSHLVAIHQSKLKKKKMNKKKCFPTYRPKKIWRRYQKQAFFFFWPKSEFFQPTGKKFGTGNQTQFCIEKKPCIGYLLLLVFPIKMLGHHK